MVWEHRYVCPNGAKVVEPLKLGTNQVCPVCSSPVMISKKEEAKNNA
jgi:DNA-directed RNA polymerase subunit RPC12/RpoP